MSKCTGLIAGLSMNDNTPKQRLFAVFVMNESEIGKIRQAIKKSGVNMKIELSGNIVQMSAENPSDFFIVGKNL